MIRGLQAGAQDYFLKDTDLEQLLQAIRRAASGETLVQPDIMERVLSLAARTFSPQQAAGRKKPEDLTERERAILARVAGGERSKEIAAHLGLSERTVGAYLTMIYTKLGVDSRASAVAVAIERGLLPHSRE
jgi:NarL family two-component system response regulator YdfI